MMKILYKIVFLLCLSISAFAQGKLEDYKRAKDYSSKISNTVYHSPSFFRWNEKGDLFWYEKNTSQGKEYVLVDPKEKTKEQLFKFTELSEAIKKETNKSLEPNFAYSAQIKLIDKNSFDFRFDGFNWTWNRGNNTLIKKAEIDRRERNDGYWGQRFDDSKGDPIESPDKLKSAYIKNNNIYVADKGNPKSEKQLTFDGSANSYYSARMEWSPDSKKIASSIVKKASTRVLTLIESSPLDQLQPKLQTRDYPKPGDDLSQYIPVIYNLETQKLIEADKKMIENQFSLYRIQWRNDSRAISFEYNKRGHQQFAIVELNANNGNTKYLINETSKTFIDYSSKNYRYDLNDGKEIFWASERDGWNHLYLINTESGTVQNQITKGNWVVRKVLNVDEKNKKIFFEGSGKNNQEDPYFIHYYSVGFDGKNLKELTKEKANHSAVFNADQTLFINTYSTINQPSVTVLKNAEGDLIMELEKADISKLQETGWKAPEVFTSKSRDGNYDIWGIILRPSNFDPNKKYPVIEYIYAGPHSSFVPKSFIPNPSGMQEIAELGFIVVQIDGMGTSNRSKAFHDVSWQNLKDAGFPDRILWMKDAAKKYPYMDLDRVGIYGTSAGGQSSTAAVLFHPEFYKVAVSSCGCHDNRMDKIWWNEQFMGWPIGPHYAACSNVENASNLQGKLMLIVGELDDNVDPSSTYQLSNALIKANKEHELILVPGMGHSSGGAYGEKKRRDFFVKHLLNVDPPSWNAY